MIKSLLYALIWLSSLMASAGMTILNWAMTPSFFSGDGGVMNRVSIYESWRFIRDFFNIFFIFALLFSAFATIFQVEQYSIKKMLLSLVLWALLVNFSFPIARFMVDLSNVPMYYFANQLFNPGSTGNMGSILSATKLENLIFTGKADEKYSIAEQDYPEIFAAIIFLFLLGVTLLVLGVMFVIRTVALITLVIFSAVGFSGLAIPWFRKYAGMWWDNMFKYLIYGPAATLLILIAVRFFAEIGRDSDMTFRNIQTAAGTASTGDMQVMIGSMAMYTIPIAMLWMSIGLAGSFSIFGAGAVSGWAKKKSLSFGKGFGMAMLPTHYAKGLAAGTKERMEKSKLTRWAMPKTWKESGERREAQAKGFAKGGFAGAAKATQSLRDKQINEKAEEHKKNKTNNSTLRSDLDSKDEVTRKAAAMALVENKAIDNPDTLVKSMAAVGDDAERAAKILSSAKPEALDLTLANFEKLMDSPAFAKRDGDGKLILDASGKTTFDENSKAFKDISTNLKKEGQSMVLAEFEHKRSGGTWEDAFNKVTSGMNADTMAKQSSLHKNRDFRLYAGGEMADPNNKQYYQEVYKKMNKDDRQTWANEGIIP